LKIIHHISFHQKEVPAFQRCGVEPELLEGGDLVHLATADIAEDDPRWNEASQLVKKLKALDVPFTKFSDDELRSARHLAVLPNWHHGYPQPEGDFDYLSATYDLSSYCRTCRIGAKQIRPFRMKKEPTWGKHSILQLNWVFDEYFVRPETWHSIFEQFGIGFRPVLHHKTGNQLQSIVQLDITQTTDLKTENLALTQCSVCKRQKYPPTVTGFFPAPSSTYLVLAKSRQYFGSGASAFQQIMVGHELYVKIKKAGMKGADFQACKAE
jgi:hypothetical protein